MRDSDACGAGLGLEQIGFYKPARSRQLYWAPSRQLSRVGVGGEGIFEHLQTQKIKSTALSIGNTLEMSNLHVHANINVHVRCTRHASGSARYFILCEVRRRSHIPTSLRFGNLTEGAGPIARGGQAVSTEGPQKQTCRSAG